MRGPKHPGDFGDPVADSIRRQQQRDAMPTQKEAKDAHRRFLASEGCRECGEDDPDELSVYRIEVHSCSVRQAPPPQSVVYCEDCAEERPSLRERAAETLEADDRLGILFTCGTYEFVSRPDAEDVQGPYRGPALRVLLLLLTGFQDRKRVAKEVARPNWEHTTGWIHDSVVELPAALVGMNVTTACIHRYDMYSESIGKNCTLA